VLIAYGGMVPFIATLAMLASARGLALQITDGKTQVVTVDRSSTSGSATPTSSASRRW
jgi:ribose/xylose/arabinose/galactoside ABC-type transport system permease subunit